MIITIILINIDIKIIYQDYSLKIYYHSLVVEPHTVLSGKLPPGHAISTSCVQGPEFCATALCCNADKSVLLQAPRGHRFPQSLGN